MHTEKDLIIPHFSLDSDFKCLIVSGHDPGKSFIRTVPLIDYEDYSLRLNRLSMLTTVCVYSAFFLIIGVAIYSSILFIPYGILRWVAWFFILVGIGATVDWIDNWCPGTTYDLIIHTKQGDIRVNGKFSSSTDDRVEVTHRYALARRKALAEEGDKGMSESPA